jgi:hypothetical protein
MPVVTVEAMPAVILVEGTEEVMPEVGEVVAASSREVVKEAVLVVADAAAMDAEAMAPALMDLEVVWAVVDAGTAVQVMVAQVMVAQVMVGQVTGMEIDQAVVTMEAETTGGAITAEALAVRVASVATTPVGNRPKHVCGRPQTSKP